MATLHYLGLAAFLVAGIMIGFVGGVQAMKDNPELCVRAKPLVIK